MAAAPIAVSGVKAIVGIVAGIFGGMARRAAQAKNENSALQQCVQGFDQAVQQIAQDYNNGNITQSDAQAEIASIWSWFWQSITPAMQPNRNGCSSGGNCPGNVKTYSSTNGAPTGYCSGNIGAACCVGCGPIRLSLDSLSDVINAGSGTAKIAGIVGDHYGLQTRAAYTLQFKKPSESQAIVGTVLSATGSLLTTGSLQRQPVLSSPVSSGAYIPASQNNTFLYIGAGLFLLVLALLFRR